MHASMSILYVVYVSQGSRVFVPEKIDILLDFLVGLLATPGYLQVHVCLATLDGTQLTMMLLRLWHGEGIPGAGLLMAAVVR